MCACVCVCVCLAVRLGMLVLFIAADRRGEERRAEGGEREGSDGDTERRRAQLLPLLMTDRRYLQSMNGRNNARRDLSNPAGR